MSSLHCYNVHTIYQVLNSNDYNLILLYVCSMLCTDRILELGRKFLVSKSNIKLK